MHGVSAQDQTRDCRPTFAAFTLTNIIDDAGDKVSDTLTDGMGEVRQMTV